MARLQEQYVNEIAPALNKKFGYKSVMQIPKLDKVIINVAAGEAKENAKVIDAIVADLGQITGQKAIVCKARKSVANFKLREGMPIGAKVTLRGERMYEFVDRLFNVALPRVRDFRGINGNSFDGRGNYAFGLKEQIIFPEIDFDKVDAIRGMDICFVTTAKTDEEAMELLKTYHWPGNVRELEHTIEAALNLTDGSRELRVEDIPAYFFSPAGASAAGSGGANTRSVPNVPLREAVADYERGLIRQALQEAKGNIDRAAALLQIPRTTLYSRMSKLGLR